MLYIVIKTSKQSSDTGVEATLSSVPKSIDRDVRPVLWQPEAGDSTTGKLAEFLAEKSVSDEDFVMVVSPGVVFNKKILARLVNQKWYDSANRIRVVKRNADPYWMGMTPIAIQYDLLSQLNFNLRDFNQDDRSRFFLEALRQEWWYSSIEGEVDFGGIPDIRNMSADSSALYDITWYIEFQKRWHALLRQYEFAPPMTQLAYIYMLQWRLIHNMNGSNKFVLQGSNLTTFYKYLKQNLQYIEDRVLLQTPSSQIRLDKNICVFLLKLKHLGVSETYQYSSRNIVRVFNRSQIDTAIKSGVTIESMDFHDNKLVIDGFSRFSFDPEESYLVCRCDDKEYKLPDTQRFSEQTLFGQTVFRYMTFRVEIPKEVVEVSRMISFHAVSSNRKTDVRLGIAFGRAMSKLNAHRYSYWSVSELRRILKYKGRVLWITPSSSLRIMYHELRYGASLLFGGKNMRKAAWLRVAYYLTKPLYRRPIWLFSDKPYKAGDNGEYLWDYVREKSDGIEKHYVLSRAVPDAKRFKQENKPFVPYASLKHKLMVLHADILFATHENQISHNSIKWEGAYLRDLFNYDTLFLQHGLTVQRLSRVLNRSIDNIKLYFVASPFETENLLRPEYGYSKDVIATSGVARYDGLVSKSKKQILIAPTWRSYLAKPGSGDGTARRKNESFKTTKYYQLYNKIINNKKLLSTVDKYGYRIIFLLHPITSAQIDDFNDHDDRVEVVASTEGVSYEKLLTESDLMVTDYSGIQFDFAYMKKPILYYHPKELPPTYEEAVYSYERDALGEVIEVHDVLIRRLCDYIENGCKTPEKYQKRMDEFFYHHDSNSAQRIYKEAIKFQENNR